MGAKRTKAKDHARFGATVARPTAFAIAAMATIVAMALVGCVASETAPPARGYVVNGPPPAPIVESRPPPPTATAVAPNAPPPVWVAGYWHWVGVQYAWIPGHWEEPPAGARWAAPQYSMRDGTYFYAPGDWQRAPGAPQVQPQVPPPQNANAFSLRFATS